MRLGSSCDLDGLDFVDHSDLSVKLSNYPNDLVDLALSVLDLEGSLNDSLEKFLRKVLSFHQLLAK